MLRTCLLQPYVYYEHVQVLRRYVLSSLVSVWVVGSVWDAALGCRDVLVMILAKRSKSEESDTT